MPEFESPADLIEALGSEMERAHGTPLILFVLDRLIKGFRGDPRRAEKTLSAILGKYGNFFAWKSGSNVSQMAFVITRCWYFRFFSDHGVPRLTTCACRLDGLWFNRMDPRRHGLRFRHDRYTTRGYGAEHCVFPIERAGPG